ncbi:M24 family metallopeptidase [Methanoregula sp.]|uniref:M24 family metallopeptidase n=1 Tax=Methanoregula sp. TaxID=2052170 RepID=UPI003565F22C
MQAKVPQSELKERLRRFYARMDETHPAWELAIISSKVNLYYFTGTIQDAILVIPRNGEAVLWVRRSHSRAVDDSHFPQIRPMQSYRNAAEALASIPKTVHIEKEQITLAMCQRLRRHFPFDQVVGIDDVVAYIRSIKSLYERELMERAGTIHRRVLEDLAPDILREGMSEADFSSELYSVMMREGHHGIVRFGMSEAEFIHGLTNFGESSIYPTFLDSPGGNAGMSPAVPLLGSRERKLKKGDLVFCDIGCGYHGYHTDKTMTYVFCGSLPDEAVAVHEQCVDILDAIVPLLRPGAVPSEIYRTITDSLEPAFLENFMGYGKRKVQFLGHGIGLEIAENPVIAKGFDEPVKEGMVFALEPKKGIKGIGMVGTENTFLVTPNGGRSITGSHPGLMPVG